MILTLITKYTEINKVNEQEFSKVNHRWTSNLYLKKQYIYTVNRLDELMYRLIIFILFLPILGSSQSTFQPKQVELDLRGVIYRSERSVDFRLHTNGMALALNIGKIKTYDQTNYLHFEVGFIKDPREKKQNKNLSIGPFGQSNSFAFGKINHVFVLRGGWGYRRFLSEKAKRKGLAIGYNYEFWPFAGHSETLLSGTAIQAGC